VGGALASVFGVIAVLLAGVSVYSLVSVRMLSRIRELAVRVALGATPRQVSWLACTTSVRLLGAAGAAGLLLAMMGTGVLRAKVSGVTAPGVFVYLTVAAIVAAAVGVGTAVPALRVARLDPMRALRRE
jgi:putative ABC transport system permease protein